GKDYDADWFRRMRGEGVHAKLIARRFELARKAEGLDRRPPTLRCDLFRVPPRTGDQLTLGL
ncbi:MAG: radical SAM protein, partial [Paracoccaceae bacterium]